MGDNMGGHSLEDVKKVCHRNLSLVVYKGKIWYLENLLTILRPLTEKYPFKRAFLFQVLYHDLHSVELRFGYLWIG